MSFGSCQVLKYNKAVFRQQKLAARNLRNQDSISSHLVLSTLLKYSLQITPEFNPISLHINTLPNTLRHSKTSLQLPLPINTSSEKPPNILLFCSDSLIDYAHSLGISHAGSSEDFIQKILPLLPTITHCLSTLETFPKILKIAKHLGPLKLMPSPAKNTVSDDIKSLLSNINAQTTIEVKQDSLNMAIGHDKMTDVDLFKNIHAVVDSVYTLKPAKVDHSKFIQQVCLSMEYTPAVTLGLKQFNRKKSTDEEEI